MSEKGKLYLIPTYLDETNDHQVIAPIVIDVIRNTRFFLVENVRTARRYISSLKLGIDISELSFEEITKSTSQTEIISLMNPLKSGNSLGLISEAGLPAIADPGKLAVAYAHNNSIEVVPLPGASSIIQALIASGFNGQAFCFHGYLPIDAKSRKATLQKIEKDASQTGFTQLFMETPYRNQKLLEDMLRLLSRDSRLLIATCITGSNEFIRTKSIGYWQKNLPDIHKKPTIFGIGL